MTELKSLHPEGVAAALARADRYRLLADPTTAESICLDVLKIEPTHQSALITLLLALTDQFGKNTDVTVKRAQELLPRLTDPYAKVYYDGIIRERWAKARLFQNRGVPGVIHQAYDWLRDAMDCYEKADALHPPGNEEALLHWNGCARLIARHKLVPGSDESRDYPLE
jgi:hypothetical protein